MREPWRDRPKRLEDAGATKAHAVKMNPRRLGSPAFPRWGTATPPCRAQICSACKGLAVPTRGNASQNPAIGSSGLCDRTVAVSLHRIGSEVRDVGAMDGTNVGLLVGLPSDWTALLCVLRVCHDPHDGR